MFKYLFFFFPLLYEILSTGAILFALLLQPYFLVFFFPLYSILLLLDKFFNLIFINSFFCYVLADTYYSAHILYFNTTFFILNIFPLFPIYNFLWLHITNKYTYHACFKFLVHSVAITLLQMIYGVQFIVFRV